MADPGRPRKCDPKVEDLSYNIRQGDYRTAKNTLEEFGIDAGDSYGRSVLINAVIENKIDFIYWLVEKGANINHQDRNGYTALHFASQNLLINIAEYLLENGADPDIRDKHGNVALWKAIFGSMGKDITIIKILLKYNADPEILNNYNATPASLYKDRYGENISNLI